MHNRPGSSTRDVYRHPKAERQITTANELYQAARELPCDAKHLLVLMHQQDIDAEAWDAEIAKRLGEIGSGKVKMIPGDEFHAMLRERLSARGV